MAEDNVVVEQVDRDAAWPFRERKTDGPNKERWDSGFYDAIPIIQSFARHRLATQAHEPSADVVERVGIALCQKALGGKQCPCAATGVFRCADEHPGEMATAAIAAMRPESERPGIVAWLRDWATYIAGVTVQEAEKVADAIERGDHIKEPSHD